MNTNRETFGKDEKLCSNKAITSLFEEGNIFYTSLFKVVWGTYSGTFSSPARLAFSVSKKGFRLAVTRNLIKRRLREAYRKNKKPLYDYLITENIHINFVVIIRGNNIPDYSKTERAVIEMINKLIFHIKNTERKVLD